MPAYALCSCGAGLRQQARQFRQDALPPDPDRLGVDVAERRMVGLVAGLVLGGVAGSPKPPQALRRLLPDEPQAVLVQADLLA